MDTKRTAPAAATFTVHGGDYEHVQRVAGTHGDVHLIYQPRADLNELFSEVLASRPHEICEFSLANYLTLRASGDDSLTAIPVFPNRAFRHGTLVVRRESPVVRPQQLAGLRVGVEDYSMSAAVWVRGLLRQEYGVDPNSITWLSGPSQRFPTPAGARVETSDKDIETLLMEGTVDAIVGLSLRDAKLPSRARQLRSVLPNPEATEQAYFERTGIYPINHCVVLRKDALQRHPDLIDTVAQAYLRAKEEAYKRRLGSTLVPWGKSVWNQTFEIFGGDPLPYGLTQANRNVIATLAGYLRDQGFIASIPDTDSIFAVPACLAARAN